MNSPKYSRLAPGQRRDQILDAANALFAERAYDAVSIEDIASSAGVTRGLVHHYFGGRKEVYIGLLERHRRPTRGPTPPTRRAAAPARASPTACRAGWTGPKPTAPSGWPRSRTARTSPTPTSAASSPTSCSAPSRCSTTFHADIAQDSPRLRYALECWTALNRAATRRWLRGQATREATHELLTSTLEHILRTFGSPPAPRRRTPPP